MTEEIEERIIPKHVNNDGTEKWGLLYEFQYSVKDFNFVHTIRILKLKNLLNTRLIPEDPSLNPDLPSNEEYLRNWGEPRTKIRYWRIKHSILEIRKLNYRHKSHVEKWDEDLEWFENEYGQEFE